METAWFDDDPGLLEEALSMLVDWDEPSSTQQGAPPIPSVVRAAQPEQDADAESATDSSNGASERRMEPRRAVKINLSRERQRQETRELREQAVELQQELERLRVRRVTKPRLEQPRPLDQDDARLVAWEAATRRQFRSRKRSEALNARLRELLATQSAVARDLFDVLQRSERVRQETMNTAIFPVNHPKLTMADAASDFELETRLAKISAQWSVPYAHCPKFQYSQGQNSNWNFFESTVIRDDGVESVLDIRACKAFPYAKHTVESELWHYFLTLQCSEENFSLATTLKVANNRLAGGLRATSCKDGVLGILDARLMKQRFRNEFGDLVLTSTTCGRPGLKRLRGPLADDGLAEVDAIVFEDSWLRVVDANEGDKLAIGSPLTLIQHVRRSRVHFCGADRPDRGQVEAVKKFLAHLAENELRWGQEVTERRLMLGPSNFMYSNPPVVPVL